ncbi:MAG: sigma-70 family RNA polymerase sigma factor [Chloroflexi bacterium]|nr:sigma-70 family RNA polymerase sigma factor [Chloroflexota bacterium]
MTINSTALDEKQLLQNAINGDQQAFASIYDTYVDEIYRFIYFRVEDQPTAEDITSTVFLRAWENLGGFEIRKAPFKAWIYHIARNAVIDHYRASKSNTSLEAIHNVADAGATSVTQPVETLVEGEKLAKLLPELTEDQRNVLVLKFVQGYSKKEVADALGKRQGAIRALQMRALQALAQLMEMHDE